MRPCAYTWPMPNVSLTCGPYHLTAPLSAVPWLPQLSPGEFFFTTLKVRRQHTPAAAFCPWNCGYA